jgi:allantoicase
MQMQVQQLHAYDSKINIFEPLEMGIHPKTSAQRYKVYGQPQMGTQHQSLTMKGLATEKIGCHPHPDHE